MKLNKTEETKYAEYTAAMTAAKIEPRSAAEWTKHYRSGRSKTPRRADGTIAPKSKEDK